MTNLNAHTKSVKSDPLLNISSTEKNIPAGLILARSEDTSLSIPLITEQNQDKNQEKHNLSNHTGQTDQTDQTDQAPATSDSTENLSHDAQSLLNLEQMSFLTQLASKLGQDDSGHSDSGLTQSGQLDAVEDTRYDWSKAPSVSEEVKAAFQPNIPLISEPEPCDQPKIPEQTIDFHNTVNTDENHQVVSTLNKVFESDLPSESAAVTDNASISFNGNLFNTVYPHAFNFGDYTIDQINITDLGLFFQSYDVNKTDPHNWILTSDHFIFDLDTTGADKGDYSYTLTDNVYNTPNPSDHQNNDDFLDDIRITLTPNPIDDDCIPPSTDVKLQVRVVDDAQVAQNKTYDFSDRQNLSGNVLTDANPDIPSADGGMHVTSVLGTTDVLLNSNNQETVLTTALGGILDIKPNGDFTYSPPISPHEKEYDYFSYTSEDSDGTHSTAQVTINIPAAPEQPA